MRILAALLVLLIAAVPAFAQTPRERILLALELVDELELDDATAHKLLPVLSAYEREREKLLGTQVDLLERIRLIDDSAVADKLLDELLALQRSLVAAETTLVAKLRKLLPAEQAARARVMLLTPYQRDAPRRRAPPRRDDLFPPGSQLTPYVPCDPFASMHGC